MLTIDPLAFVNGLWRTHKLGDWFKAALGVHIAGLSSFCGACGYQLYVEHQPWLIGVGFGMMMAQAAIVTTATANPQLRGLMVGWWKPPVIPPEFNRIEVDKVDPK